MAYNPASQIVTETRSNTAYAQVLSNGTQTSVTNGRNELATINGTSAAYDARGNMTTDPATAKTYGYSSENQLTTASGGVTLTYDPAMRLNQVSAAATSRFTYDGVDVLGEYDSSNALQRRWVYDPTTGQPVIWYEGTGVAASDRRYFSQDERGSIISVSDSTAASLGINTYDEYGIPAATNVGRFQYAGMMWLSEIGLYAPTFRDYGAHLGRFNQTDPLGYAGDGPNLYAYVLNDPVNRTDPLGLFLQCRLAGVGAAGSPLNWGTACYENGVNVSSQEPGRGNRGERADVGDKGDKAQKSQGKPAKCLTQRYRLGKDIDDFGRFLQRATVIGGGFVALMSVPEGGFVPTAVAAVRMYAYASAVRTLGTALMSDPHQGIQEVVTMGLGRMASADPIGEWIAGEVLGLVAKQVERPNPCNE